MFEFEFSDYYNSKFTPAVEFGHLFFLDWDNDEWDRFYMFMIECIRIFLSEGLIECSPVNLTKKRIIYSTSYEFFEFAESLLETEIKYDKTEIQLMFQDEFPDQKVSAKQFFIWLETYSEIKGWRFSTTRSNGRRFFTFHVH